MTDPRVNIPAAGATDSDLPTKDAAKSASAEAAAKKPLAGDAAPAAKPSEVAGKPAQPASPAAGVAPAKAAAASPAKTAETPPARRVVPLTPMPGPSPEELEAARIAQRVNAFDQRARARPRFRHLMLLLSFLLFVAGPLGVAAWYLWDRAADQYASHLGFLVQSEDSAVPMDTLSGLVGGLTKSSSSNTDILYKYIQSQTLVERINEQLDLRQVWSKRPEDFVFGYTGGPSIEDLMEHWQRQVQITYDQGTIDLRVLAYDPADAQRIAQLVMDESQLKINELNDVARSDKMRYAQDDLARSLDRLKQARNAVTTFRNQYQIIDPLAYASGQEGVLATLQQQLAEALIQLGITRSNAPGGDQRVEQAQLRVDVIREQIEAERARVSQAGGSPEATTDGTSNAMSDLFGRYEALEVERQFAETIYTTAMANYERVRSEADRQSLYLAAYVRPTLAEMAEYPRRVRLLLMVGGFLMLGWLIGVMIYYSVRDRR